MNTATRNVLLFCPDPAKAIKWSQIIASEGHRVTGLSDRSLFSEVSMKKWDLVCLLPDGGSQADLTELLASFAKGVSLLVLSDNFSWLSFLKKSGLHDFDYYLEDTPRQLLHHRIGILSRAVEPETEAAEQKGEMLKRLENLAGMLAHDLKSPLFSLVAVVQRLLKHEQLSAAHQNLLQLSAKSMDSMLQQIEETLTCSRFTKGDQQSNAKLTDAHQLIEECFEQMALEADTKGITLVNQIPAMTYLYTDPAMLAIVIKNLISNSLKYCSPGNRVSIGFQSQNLNQLWVCDDGPGFGEVQARQFNKGSLISSLLGKYGEQGTGIGLRFCREIMAQMNGSLSLVKGTDQGTSFLIELGGESLYRPVEARRVASYKPMSQSRPSLGERIQDSFLVLGGDTLLSHKA